MTQMSPQQLTAYLHPCFAAEETMHSRFYGAISARGRLFSVGVTANIGLE